MIQIFCQRQWLEKRQQKLKKIQWIMRPYGLRKGDRSQSAAEGVVTSNANMAASSDAGTIVPTVAGSGVTDRMQDKVLLLLIQLEFSSNRTK